MSDQVPLDAFLFPFNRRRTPTTAYQSVVLQGERRPAMTPSPMTWFTVPS